MICLVNICVISDFLRSLLMELTTLLHCCYSANLLLMHGSV